MPQKGLNETEESTCDHHNEHHLTSPPQRAVSFFEEGVADGDVSAGLEGAVLVWRMMRKFEMKW